MKTRTLLASFVCTLALSVFAGAYRPGLNQGKANSNSDWSFSLENSAIPVELVPGPVMADVYAEESTCGEDGHTYLNPVTGTRYAWNKQNTTFAYIGEIYLEAGVTYVFAKRLDDAARIVIGETVVLENGAWDAFAQGSFTPEATGWYPVDIRIADGNGGKGLQNNGVGGSGFGLAYNRLGATSESGTTWHPLRDPGDLSLFRAPVEEKMSFIRGVSLADGVYTFTLSVSGGSGTARVYLNGSAVSNPSPADLAAMDASSDSVSIPAGGTATATVAWNGASAPYVVVHVSGSDALGGFDACTDPVVFDSAAISPPVADIPTADTGVLTSSVLFCGPASSSADVTFAYGPAGQPLPAPSATRTGLAAGDSMLFFLPDLEWGAEYAYEIVVDGDGDAPVSFTGRFLAPTESTAGLPGVLQGRYKCSNSNPLTTTRIADLPATAVDNALGMLMARASSDNVTGTNCTDPMTSQGWGWNEDGLCFLYEGYIWLEADVPYYVVSKYDDGGAVYLDDTMVFDQWEINGTGSGYNDKGNYAVGTYVPAYTGWHDFRGYIWDWGGGKNKMWGVAGVQWTTNSAAVTVSSGTTVAVASLVGNPVYWHEFYDDGSGTFLTLAPPALEVGSVAMEGDTLIATVSVPVIGACSLRAWYGATYGGADPDAWEHTSDSLGTFAGDGTEDAIVRLDIGASARYVRFFTVPEEDASPSVSRTLCRSQLTAVTDAPNVSASAPTDCGVDSAAVPLRVLSAGAGSDTCDVYAIYGLSADALTCTNLLASGLSTGASVSPRITGLHPDRQYVLFLRSVSDQGADSLSPALGFRTAKLADTGVYAGGDSQPGLWQSFAGFYQDRSDPAAAADAEVVPGAIMAAAGNNPDRSPFTSYTAPSGRTFSYQLNSTYSYSGYMLMEGGATYTFGADFDDWTFLSVDGRTLIDDTGYDSKVFASFTPPASGWYPIVVRVGDAGGNVGATDGPFATAYLGSGFGFSTTATTLTTENYAQWRPLTNTVDSVLFRTAPGFRRIEAGYPVVEDGVLTVPLTFGSDGLARDLYVCYGPSYGDTNVAAWAHVEKLGTVAADAMSYTSDGDVAGVYDSVRYVRYFFDCGAEGKSWSRTLVFDDPALPVLDLATTVSGLERGDGAVISGALDSTGGSVCTVTLEISRDPSFADAYVWPAATLSAPGAFSVDVYTDDTSSAAYIEPGVRHYYRFVAVNADGAVDVSGTESFTPADGVNLGVVSASSSMWTVTVTGSFADFGAGGTSTLWLYAGTSPDALAPVGEQTLAADGDFTFTTLAPAIGEPFYYAVLASNACSTVWWNDWSETQSITPFDAASYYWKGDVQSGAWNDADCWDTVPDDPRLTYPNADTANAYFSNCTSGEPYTVSVPGSYRLRVFVIGAANADISFVAAGDGASSLYTKNAWDDWNPGFGMAEGATVTFDGVSFETADCYKVPARSTLRVLNGGLFKTGREIWMDGTDSCIEARGDSTVCVGGWSFQLYGDGGHIVLDDSTFVVNSDAAYLAYRKDARNNVVEFYGSHPKFIARSISAAAEDVASAENTGVPKLVFHVPAEGYAEAPVQRNSESFVLQGNDKQDIRVEIAKDSGWFQGCRTATLPLIAWGPGILASRLDLADQPRPQATTLFWTYGSNLTDATATESDGNNPTGLWAKLVGSGTTVILFR